LIDDSEKCGKKGFHRNLEKGWKKITKFAFETLDNFKFRVKRKKKFRRSAVLKGCDQGIIEAKRELLLLPEPFSNTMRDVYE
jgi:hypothetical protein